MPSFCTLFCALRPPPEVAGELWSDFAWLPPGDDRVEPERQHVTLIGLGAWDNHPEEAIVRDRILAQGDSGEYEKEYIHKDGSVFPVSLRAWPVMDAGGEVSGMRGFVRDITDRKRVEEALRDADRRKNEFIATLSHELRNPLAPIRNGLQVLRKTGGQGPSAERARELMERQVEHLVRLVDDLLEVSRVSHGKIELRKERLDLAVVVNRAEGKKCARSWRITKDVGLDSAYPDLSARDAAAVHEIDAQAMA